MFNRRIAWRHHYSIAFDVLARTCAWMGEPALALAVLPDQRLGGAERLHGLAADQANRALAEEDRLFGAEELDIGALEAQLERLQAEAREQGELIAALQAEARDQERDLQVCDEGFEELAQTLWGDEAGRPKLTLTCEVGVLANWLQLRDRHVAQMVSAVRQIEQAKNGQRGAVAAELAETQKQLEKVTNDYLSTERSCQTHERILDQLWETVHPGQEQDDDAEPEELARQICEKWADLGREQQQKDRAIEACGEQTLDGLAELQKRVREIGDRLRERSYAISPVELLEDFADLFGPATPGLLGGNALVEPAELALGKQMGDAIATAIYGEGRG